MYKMHIRALESGDEKTMSWSYFKDKCKRSVCCGSPVIDSPNGPICSKEGCYKLVDGEVYIHTHPVTPSFYEPKEIEPEKWQERVNFEGYEVGEDAECMPDYKEPKTGLPVPNSGIPERYKKPENSELL